MTVVYAVNSYRQVMVRLANGFIQFQTRCLRKNFELFHSQRLWPVYTQVKFVKQKRFSDFERTKSLGLQKCTTPDKRTVWIGRFGKLIRGVFSIRTFTSTHSHRCIPIDTFAYTHSLDSSHPPIAKDDHSKFGRLSAFVPNSPIHWKFTKRESKPICLNSDNFISLFKPANKWINWIQIESKQTFEEEKPETKEKSTPCRRTSLGCRRGERTLTSRFKAVLAVVWNVSSGIPPIPDRCNWDESSSFEFNIQLWHGESGSSLDFRLRNTARHSYCSYHD